MIKSDLSLLLTGKTDPELPGPLFKSISEMARLAIAHSPELDEDRLASIKTQISQALRVNDPKPLGDDIVEGILSAVEAMLTEAGKERHVKRIKPKIQAAFERLESRDLHPVTANKEDMLVKAMMIDLAQGRKIVFSRWDKMQSSKAKAAVDHSLSDWLANGESGPDLIFVVTRFKDGFRQLNDLLALSPEKPALQALETLKLCCRQKKIQFWIADSAAHFFPLTVIDPANSEERGYFFHKGEQGTCVPLNIAASDVRDWSNDLYMPLLEADECLDYDRAFGLLASSAEKINRKQAGASDSFSALDVMAQVQLQE